MEDGLHLEHRDLGEGHAEDAELFTLARTKKGEEEGEDPSNLAAMKVMPGSLVASANSWPGTQISAMHTWSLEMKPFIEPVPYWMAIFRPSC